MTTIQPLTTSDYLYIGSALSTSAAMGVVLLKMSGVAPFSRPFLTCVAAAVAFRIFSEMARLEYLESAHELYYKPALDEGQIVKLDIPGFAPLINHGADCFMNAIFQVMIHDAPFADALYKSVDPDEKGQLLCKAMDDYRHSRKISTYGLRRWMPEGQRVGQRDASEFLHRFVNTIKQEKYPDLFTKVTTQYFWERKEGEQVVETETTNNNAYEFDLTLEIPRETKCISGQELIEKHFSKRKHVGEQWKNEKTSQLFDPGEMQIKVEGDRLVFLLKRFEYPQNSKINTPVDMPEEFELSGNRYALQSIVTHHGATLSSGHYTALLHVEGEWIKANDTHISKVSDIGEDKRNGYIFFYKSRP